MELCCSSCKQHKLQDCFFKNSRRKTGHSAYCKECENLFRCKKVRRAISKRYYESNKEKSFAKSAKYRANKRNAVPPWLTEDMKIEIDSLHDKARTLDGYHVDHIVPLAGKRVCGLHVPWNLQLLPARENLLKSNKEML